MDSHQNSPLMNQLQAVMCTLRPDVDKKLREKLVAAFHKEVRFV